MSGVPCAHCQGSHPCVAEVLACGQRKRAEFLAWLAGVQGRLESDCATRRAGASVTTSEQANPPDGEGK